MGCQSQETVRSGLGQPVFPSVCTSHKSRTWLKWLSVSCVRARAPAHMHTHTCTAQRLTTHKALPPSSLLTNPDLYSRIEYRTLNIQKVSPLKSWGQPMRCEGESTGRFGTDPNASWTSTAQRCELKCWGPGAEGSELHSLLQSCKPTRDSTDRLIACNNLHVCTYQLLSFAVRNIIYKRSGHYWYLKASKLFSIGSRTAPLLASLSLKLIADYYLSGRLLRWESVHPTESNAVSYSKSDKHVYTLEPRNLNLEIHPRKISQLQKKKLEKSIDTKMLIVTLSLQENEPVLWGQNQDLWWRRVGAVITGGTQEASGVLGKFCFLIWLRG